MFRSPKQFKPTKISVDIFQNQIDFGKLICNQFLNPFISTVLALAPTQSGKTGSMLALIQAMMFNYSLAIPPEHVFVITGHSSIEWIEQTKQRFPKVFHNHIYHRNNLNNFSEDIKSIHSALVIIDENQIALEEGQSVQNSFIMADLLDISYLFSRDIRVVHFTATPIAIQNFDNSHSTIVKMIPPKDYISLEHLYDSGRLRQYKDLCGKIPGKDYSKVNWLLPHTFIKPSIDIIHNIKEIRPFISLQDPKYHIIRTPPSYLHDVVISNFIQVFGKFNFNFISDLDSDILSIKPDKHTFIFIKEKLRCAKTIHKEHLGILYERISQSVSDHVIVQGLAGRLTGYHNNTHSIVFTNLVSVRRYLLQWKEGFF
jgi:hypothetical protein